MALAAGPPPRAMLPPRPWKRVRPRPALLADGGDGFLGLEEGPVGGEVAAVLVAVGVAEHDLLVVAAGLEVAAVGLEIEHLVEDAGGGLEVAEGLEERRDVERDADEVQEDHDLDDVGEVVGHADDVDAGGLGAEELDGALEHAQGADDVAGLGLGVGAGEARRGRGEHGGEDAELLAFRQRGVGGVMPVDLSSSAMAVSWRMECWRMSSRATLRPRGKPAGAGGGARRRRAGWRGWVARLWLMRSSSSATSLVLEHGGRLLARVGESSQETSSVRSSSKTRRAQGGEGEAVGLVRIAVGERADVGIGVVPAP